MNKRVASWTSVGAVGASLLSVFAAPIEWLKNSFVFHPDTTVRTTPAEYGFRYQDVWFGGPDGQTLHGWYLPGAGDAVFVWFHGNAGNIANRLDHARVLTKQLGVSHFLFDYQGYGNSKGQPSIPGIVADGRDAIAIVGERGWATDKQLVYMGESLGCAVVIAVGIEQPPERAILLAPFYSLRAMAERVVPPLAFVVDQDLNSARQIKQFKAPVLVVHGTQDRTIPYQQGKDLFELANPPKRFHTVSGGGHTDLHLVGGEAYFRAIGEFLQDAELSESEQ